jgi:phosphoglycolate phosphatase-like HAD superfamily hydrolase
MSKKKIVLFDIDYTLFDTRLFKDSALQNYTIYEEVEKILAELKEVATLGIFSKGENEFQKTKLKKTGMLKFFEKNDIHIFVDKDANLMDVIRKYKDSKLFLVDDKLGILFSAKKNMPEITTIWVKRGPYALVQKPIEDFIPDAIIDDLSNLFNIVSSG